MRLRETLLPCARRLTARVRASALALLATAFAQPLLAAVPVHVVKTDLRPLIRAAAQSPVQFAVSVPHSVSTTSGGNWSSSANGVATWSYAVQVPTAVSLSFHAVNSTLPESAVLVVRGAKSTTIYKPYDLHRGELWSRIYPGEALQLELSVAAAERGKVALNIVSVQAGYRAIGPGVADHPYYRRLKEQAQAAGDNSSCVTNYECQVTSANAPAAAATVGLVVGNVYQCTGTLINDVPGDNAPYVLTARHCENGQPGGGAPGAAASVTVYWDATTPCGTGLNSLYGGAPRQTGAQTVVEQQDGWLLLLDSSPAVADAQFAGFDASGGAVQGGYSIHHAEGFDKQFTSWFGQAAVVQQNNVLGAGYLSNFLETVNAVGNIGPGASGSALFDQNNHLVGSLTLGRQASDSTDYGMCPVASPPAPDGTNGAADFTALSAIWNSTADTTSTTGSTTLQSVLDPGNTGTVATASAPLAIQLTTSGGYPGEGEPVELMWNAPNALQCTASGGTSGDGWSGTLPSISGNQSVTETSVGPVSYTVTCSFPGGRSAKSSLQINWQLAEPSVFLTAPPIVWTTRPAVLSWNSNFGPCAISGGGLSQSNLPAVGTLTTTQATAGDVTYTLTCGSTAAPGTFSRTVQYVTPSVILEPTGTDRMLGQSFVLYWLSYADTCATSGGAAGDGWAGNSFLGNAPGSSPPQEQFAPHVTAAGTYTYTLTCSSSSISVQQSVTVTFESNPPYITASLSVPSVTYSNSPADYVTLNWNSNISTCQIVTNPVMPSAPGDPLDIAFQAQGSESLNPPGPGTYTITVACVLGPGTGVSAKPLTLTVLPPPAPTASISISPSPVIVGQDFTITYSSTNTASCVQSSDVPPAGWGNDIMSSSGTFTSHISEAGPYTFAISCPSIDPNQGPASAQAQLTVGTITAAVSASPTTLTTGGTVTITWSSTNATSCSASGGGADGTAWTGPLATSGSVTQTATTVGTFTYEISCLSSNSSSSQAAPTTAQQAVMVSAASTSSGGTSTGGGGGHGGGSLTWIDLAMLALLRAAAAAAARSSNGSRLRTRNPD